MIILFYYPFKSVHFLIPQEEDEKWVQDYCMQVGNAYVIVYSITDRSSFESASELRIQLRRIRQAENIPIILVGNKSDLVRSREVAVEGENCFDLYHSHRHIIVGSYALLFKSLRSYHFFFKEINT